MSTPAVPLVPLGSSGIVVSALALGSWRTFERMAREDGVAVLRAARDARITFLDAARYDDETGAAPMPSGYSEVVFGELFGGAGWAQRTENNGIHRAPHQPANRGRSSV
jgi:aryl-alcohol dehydrogenase-like predicted oxidoreductase